MLKVEREHTDIPRSSVMCVLVHHRPGKSTAIRDGK